MRLKLFLKVSKLKIDTRQVQAKIQFKDKKRLLKPIELIHKYLYTS